MGNSGRARVKGQKGKKPCETNSQRFAAPEAHKSVHILHMCKLRQCLGVIGGQTCLYLLIADSREMPQVILEFFRARAY